MTTVKTIYDASKKRRVVVFQRDDKTFGFEEQRFSDEPLERAWIPIGKEDCRADTAEHAAKEAQSRIGWLSEREQ